MMPSAPHFFVCFIFSGIWLQLGLCSKEQSPEQPGFQAQANIPGLYPGLSPQKTLHLLGVFLKLTLSFPHTVGCPCFGQDGVIQKVLLLYPL